MNRRRAVGAELVPEGVELRVWAPDHRSAFVIIDDHEYPLSREEAGYFCGIAPGRAGSLYRFRFDDEQEVYPDPASRFQPDGPHGPSEVIDPSTFRWSDGNWRGISHKGAIISEIHIGTFTPEGAWGAAIAKLPLLADAGINVIEVMPVADFGGTFGWGYDGVDLWAPTRLYGRPDDFRAFVDAAHGNDIGVILDVVYNHFGPDGSYLSKFTKNYFTTKYTNEWGEAVNYDGEESWGVREFVAENAAYWIDEFHLDGFRLDATQSIHDASEMNIMRVIGDRARAAAAGKPIYLVGENEPQDTALIDRYGLDAMWNDDWHHAAMVVATGKNEAYYLDYEGKPQEFISMARHGFLYQGQQYKWQMHRRGTPSTHLESARLVCYLQNHDQIANSGAGERLRQRTSPGLFRALTALLLLGPNTPLLFQGEEFGASASFLYFADHKKELASDVAKGRAAFLEQFPSLATEEIQKRLARPDDRRTFEASKLDWSDRERHESVLELHRDLIRLRNEDRAFAAQDRRAIEGAVLSSHAFALRWLIGGDSDRLFLVNFGPDLQLFPSPEPLLAPPRNHRWEILWSSEAPGYGGEGTPPLERLDGWHVPAQAAVVLWPRS